MKVTVVVELKNGATERAATEVDQAGRTNRMINQLDWPSLGGKRLVSGTRTGATRVAQTL